MSVISILPHRDRFAPCSVCEVVRVNKALNPSGVCATCRERIEREPETRFAAKGPEILKARKARATRPAPESRE